LNLSASYSHARALPDFGDLAGTRVSTPNVRVYDFATGSEQYVLRHEGGNPDLKSAGTRTISVRAQLQPIQDRDLSLSFDYSDLRLRNDASGALGPTPQVEAALPDRFSRDLTGTLTAFDSTPVNVARQHRRLLRSGINLTTALDDGEAAATPPAGDAAKLQIALYHTWTIGDEARIRPDSGVIDLLDGAAIGNRGGSSRHLVEGQFGYAGRRFGLRLTAQWRSRTHVEDLHLPDPAGHSLTISPALTLDARMFVNLKPLGEALGLPWLKGRLNLSVDNLLGSRTRIRDEDGGKVNYYQGSGESAGRTIRLSFRKVIR
jgi:outer membrane receptor protein involved in Fe transport